MADYVLLGLVVAVVVVGILLMSCWKNKPSSGNLFGDNSPSVIYRDREVGGSNNNGGNFGGNNNGDLTRRSRGGRGDPGSMGRALQSGGNSGFGTAQDNRDYNMRMDEIATEMKGYGAYNDVTRFVGLEPSVYDSHNQWIKEMNHSTTTASMQSERDDLGDLPNKWTGLRRPNFSDHPGVEASARQDASFTKDQMVQYRHYVI
jgi:hypothetical protein